MTAVTIVEAVLLALALVYIVALLRSHADILRRLTLLEDAWETADPAVGGAGAQAPDSVTDIAGTTLDGLPITVELGAGPGPVLLAFMTSGCGACAPFWADLADRSRIDETGARVIVVTHDLTRESPARLGALAPGGVELVMSSEAWATLRVPSSPHFVLCDGPRRILGRGTALGWTQLLRMIQDARADALALPAIAPARTTADRAARAEQALARAGIESGHPSLHPGAAEARP